MRTFAKRRYRPRVEAIEDRCLLSSAVVEILNKSTYTVNFDFRWTPSSSWTAYTEAPGQGEILWTTYSNALTPQVLYDTTTSSGSQTTVSLAQGYGQWIGTGTPPDWSATLYQFQNTSTGLELYYGAPPTPTQAVVEVLNDSAYNISFDFRWTSSSPWAAYTEGPGQGEIFWTAYSNTLAPQVLYNTTIASNSQTDVSLAQGYGEWSGTGTPPQSSATLYQFQNTTTGVELYYAPVAPTPILGPAPNATPSPNWSGYAVATSLSDPQANSVTAVFGSWNVPAVTGPSIGTFDSSTWVGIDGYNNQVVQNNFTVEQLGTEQDVVNGTPVYRAWWEMYSEGAQQPEQIIPNMTILPGDSISASVQYMTSGIYAGYFYLSIVDNSRPGDFFSTYQSSSLTQNPLAERSTAEWIMEAPSVNGSIAQMPTFSTVNFTNVSAVINGVAGGISDPAWQSTALNVGSSGGSLVDTTSVLSNSGGGFSVTSNSGVSAGVQTPTGVQTAQQQVGTNNPQVIVVGKQWSPSSGLQLVVTGQPTNVSVGASFGLTVDIDDGQADVVTGYNGTVTLSLAGGPSGALLEGTLSGNAVNGVVTFPGLALSAAGTYTIEIQGSGLLSTSATISATSPDGGATQWVVSQPPPGSVTAGSSFGLQVKAKDENGSWSNLFSGQATVSLINANGAILSGGPLTVSTQNGIATFSGLVVSTPGIYTLWVSGAGLIPVSFSLDVASPPVMPFVTHASLLEQTAVMGRGRHQRTTTKFVGFTLAFNEGLNSSSVSDPSNYELLQTVRRGRKTTSESVPFEVSYDPATCAVNLVIQGKTTFSAGGTLVVVTSNITDALGGRGLGQSTFAILARATGIQA